jgi:hypothetical protein
MFPGGGESEGLGFIKGWSAEPLRHVQNPLLRTQFLPCERYELLLPVRIRSYSCDVSFHPGDAEPVNDGAEAGERLRTCTCSL